MIVEFNTDGEVEFNYDAPQERSTSLLEEERVAQTVRVASCDLATALARAAEAEDEVSSADLTRWALLAQDVNRKVLEYARLATQRVSRMNVEAALMQSSMYADVLDREATHVHTLHTLTRLERAQNGDMVQGGLARAMRTVAQLHTGTATLTSDLPLTYFGADTCMSAVETSSEDTAAAEGATAHESA